MSGMGQKLSSRRVRKTSAPSPQADDGKGASAKCHKKSCSVKVVAGARNQRCLHLDYAAL